VYVHNLDKINGKDNYQSIILLNSTSQAIAGAWGAYMHEAFLRKYLDDNSIKTNNLKLTVDVRPFPLNK